MVTKLQNNYAILSNFENTLLGHGPATALGQIVSDLAAIRSSLSPMDWKEWCASTPTPRVLDLLMQDPYTRDARRKPAGYAGDARTLDYVYLRATGPQHLTPLGRMMFDATTGIALSQAVRDRCSALARHLMERLERSESVVAASIACGHARELDFLPPEARKGLQFWGLDQDDRSLRSCRSRFYSDSFTFQSGSVAAVLRGRHPLPDSDIVYASGLFDYLDDRVAAALIRRMFSSLKPGGTLIVANLATGSEEIAYMEAIMDWWMYYRDEAAVAALAERAQLDPARNRISAYTTCEGRIAWLVVQRMEP